MMSENVVSQEWPRDVSCQGWLLPLLSSSVSRCHPRLLAPDVGRAERRGMFGTGGSSGTRIFMWLLWLKHW